MLLDLELKIKVTNNGKDNQIALTVDKNTKFQHAGTAIELVRESLTKAANNHLEKLMEKMKGEQLDEDFVANELNRMTFNDLTL